MLLPVLWRELGSRSRSLWTWWARCVPPLLIGVLGAAMAGLSASPGELGPFMFHLLGGAAWAYAWLGGALAAASAISRERQEGTLPLLRLTRIRLPDLLLSKWLGSSLHLLLGVAAVVPVLAVPLLIGGLQLEDLVRLMLGLAVVAFFSTWFGMMISAAAGGERQALVWTGSGLMVWSLATGVGGWLLQQAFPAAGFPQVLLWCSPLAGLLELRDGSLFVHWALQQLAWSAVWMLMSALLLHREGSPAPQRPAPPLRCRPARGERLSAAPLDWLVRRLSRTRGSLLIYAASALLILAVLWGVSHTAPSLLLPLCVLLPFLFHTQLKLHFLVESCRPLVRDLATGNLEVLLASPVDPADFLEGVRRHLARQFAGPVFVAAGLNAGAMLLALPAANVLQAPLVLAGFAGGVALLVSDLFCLLWMGACHALIHRTLFRAVRSTLQVTLLPGWMAWFYLLLAHLAFGEAGGLLLFWAAFLPFGLGLSAGAAGRHLALRHFRAWAALPPRALPFRQWRDAEPEGWVRPAGPIPAGSGRAVSI